VAGMVKLCRDRVAKFGNLVARMSERIESFMMEGLVHQVILCNKLVQQYL